MAGKIDYQKIEEAINLGLKVNEGLQGTKVESLEDFQKMMAALSKLAPQEAGQEKKPFLNLAGLEAYQKLKGKEIKTVDDILEIMNVLSVAIQTQGGLDGLLADLDEAQKDQAEMIFLTAKVKQLAEEKGLTPEQAEKYLIIGLKLLPIVLALI